MLSDQLSALAQRTAAGEERAKAAESQGRDALTAAATEARKSADDSAANLQLAADTAGDEVTNWWNGVQVAWSARAQKVRDDIQDKNDEKNAHRATRRADRADADADAAVLFALFAIEEAEYAVLDAALARMEADELTQ